MGIEDLRTVKTLRIPIYFEIKLCIMFGYDSHTIEIESTQPHWMECNEIFRSLILRIDYTYYKYISMVSWDLFLLYLLLNCLFYLMKNKESSLDNNS